MGKSFDSEVAAFLTEADQATSRWTEHEQVEQVESVQPRKARRQRKRRTANKKAASLPVVSGADKSAKGKAQKRAVQKKPAKAKQDCEKGLLTRGVLAGLNGIDEGLAGARRLGMGGWIAVASAIVVLGLSAVAMGRAPTAPPVQELLPSADVHVPELLVERWVRSFPQRSNLARPDRALLSDFAEHLRAQAAVAEVRSLRLGYRGAGVAKHRVIELELRLRRPVLPIMLGNGERAWVDREGVVLPGLLAGPDEEPVLRGYEQAGREALAEVLAVWPLLREHLPPGLVTAIHLDYPLDDERQRGIAFLTKPGTTLIWGDSDEGRFGLDHARKARNLLHTLRSHGDLRRVAAINVRFPEPFSVMEPVNRGG